jgi:hypothetical protein
MNVQLSVHGGDLIVRCDAGANRVELVRDTCTVARQYERAYNADESVERVSNTCTVDETLQA